MEKQNNMKFTVASICVTLVLIGYANGHCTKVIYFFKDVYFYWSMQLSIASQKYWKFFSFEGLLKAILESCTDLVAQGL